MGLIEVQKNQCQINNDEINDSLKIFMPFFYFSQLLTIFNDASFGCFFFEGVENKTFILSMQQYTNEMK